MYNPIVINELSLFLNVTSARDIGIPFSEHMHLYLTYMMCCYDDMERYINAPLHPLAASARTAFGSSTRGDLLNLMHSHLCNSVKAQAERAADSIDLIEVLDARGA